MLTIKKPFFKTLLLFWTLLLVLAGQVVLAQNGSQTSKEWYCDERLRLNLRVGTVVEVTPYQKKNGEPMMAKFTQDDVKYKTVSIVKFEMIDLYTDERNPEKQEFYNVRTEEAKAANFEVGQKYLFETNVFRAQPQSKSSDKYVFIQPKGLMKTFNDGKADIDFLRSVKDSDKYKEILGTDEGEMVSAGIMSGKFMQLVQPAYPKNLKKVKVKESVNVMVLVGERGNVIQAKAVCAKNSALATVAEQAALASKFSPTVKGEKAIKVKGIIVYNFNP